MLITLLLNNLLGEKKIVLSLSDSTSVSDSIEGVSFVKALVDNTLSSDRIVEDDTIYKDDSVDVTDLFAILKTYATSDSVHVEDGALVIRITSHISSPSAPSTSGGGGVTSATILEGVHDERRDAIERVLLDDAAVFALIKLALYNIN